MLARWAARLSATPTEANRSLYYKESRPDMFPGMQKYPSGFLGPKVPVAVLGVFFYTADSPACALSCSDS